MSYMVHNIYHMNVYFMRFFKQWKHIPKIASFLKEKATK